LLELAIYICTCFYNNIHNSSKISQSFSFFFVVWWILLMK
jgi:hypothetical protein